MNSNGHTPKAIEWATMPEWISTEEAAEVSGYHVNYIRRLMRQRKIGGRKVGLAWWVDRDSLQAYLAKVAALGPQKYTPHTIQHQVSEEKPG